LQQHAALANGEPFDVLVHSTGMLVLRAWLTQTPSRLASARRSRLKHLVALAPSTFGSPLAHKGRSFLGALLKGRKALGPDFLEAGDQVLDALELGSRFSWDLAHADLFGRDAFYRGTPDTPSVFIFCGTRGFRGVRSIGHEPGSDGAVRWAGCALNSRKLQIDLTAECADADRVQTCEWTQDDIPMIPVEGVDHGTILSHPPAWLVDRVVTALQVETADGYQRWQADTAADVEGTYQALTPWQQFIVRAVDERGDPVPDWNLQLAVGNATHWRPFAQDVHVYRHDPSLRTFHVRLDSLSPSALDGPAQPLVAQLVASTGTSRVYYQGAQTAPADPVADREGVNRAGTWRGTLDLSTVLPDRAVRFFHPFTTTFLELRLDRQPLLGADAVARWASSSR
jgi:hypothetical protein